MTAMAFADTVTDAATGSIVGSELGAEEAGVRDVPAAAPGTQADRVIVAARATSAKSALRVVIVRAELRCAVRVDQGQH